MRSSRNILVKLTVLGVLIFLLYCLQTSNVWTNHLVSRNAPLEDNQTSPLTKNVQNTSVTSAHPAKSPQPPRNSYYNVWSIFTKVTTNSPMRRKLRIFTESLMKHSTVNLTFHLITDDDSQVIADDVIKLNSLKLNKTINVQYYDVHKLAHQLEDIVEVMSPKFSSKPGTYYSDALFFISLGLHRIASPQQKFAVMLDVDTKLRKDVKLLFKEFEGFGETALFALTPELTPVYRHVLYLYRSKNPKTLFGEPFAGGGYPGYNSGVVLFHLERLRNSLEYNQIVSEDMVEHMTEKYSFKGHLGDQDFYTLLGMERPELIHTVDCGWNRQLCTWWRDRGYADVFDNYSRCDSEAKIWHGNCNTPIPED
ncbi:xyloside xylosyltransferase 1 [Diachasmimorpha longicaudata]|uniref:xyloside xylosyltransferase 1 n=1 Tax=Diachasmimorpha longicaudata TaxID=58733 RepID=UPI0030B879AF